jgi:uncharacterized OB-fold protein
MQAIAEGLWTAEDPPRLIGGCHRITGRIVFPRPENPDFAARPLRRDGVLWSYTIQRYRPKTPPYAGPEAFKPWVVAYVELPGEVIVQGRLVNVPFDAIHIGMPVELTIVPLDPVAADSVFIHAFQPVETVA